MEITHIKPKITYDNFYEKKLNVAAYVRVSTKRDVQLNSFESQINYYTDKISKNNNWKLYKIYADKGKTGKSMDKRPNFVEMYNDAIQGKIDLILTKSVSRFARNAEDLLKVVRTLKAKGIGIIFEEENINTLNQDGEFLLSVLASVAQTEADNISSHINFSFRYKMEKGILSYQSRTYGYKYIDGKFKIINKEAKVVRTIFDMYANGKSSVEICNYLNENKIKTLKKNKWRFSGVIAILRNSIYSGNLIQGRDRTSKIENYYIVRNNHEAIVPRETYDKVQEILESKLDKNKERDLIDNIYCGTCGRKAGCREKKKGGIKYFSCSNKKCNFIAFKRNILEETFNDLLIRIINLDTNTNIYKNTYIKCTNLINMYNNEKINLLNDLMNQKINNYNYKMKIDELNKLISIQEKKLDKNNKYDVLTKKGKKIKEEIINKIIDNSDDISTFDKKLFYKLIDFTLTNDKYHKKIFKFYYKDNSELIRKNKINYVEYANNFELLFEYERVLSVNGRGSGIVDMKTVVKFYIRKD